MGSAFQKYIELTCSHCGCAEHFQTGSIAEAKRQAIDFGYIVRDKNAYCTSECYQASKVKQDKRQ